MCHNFSQYEWHHVVQSSYTKSLTVNKTVKETYKFIVIAVTADGLVPLGAMASSGTAMTKFRFGVYTGEAIEGFTSK